MIKVKIFIGSSDDVQSWMCEMRKIIPSNVEVKVIAPNNMSIPLEDLCDEDETSKRDREQSLN